MDNAKSRQALLEFLDYLAQKGLVAHTTIQSRKASANAVLGILNEAEAEDVTIINLDDVMTRFVNLQGKGYNPKSLATYKSRVRSALDDFSRYVDNPLGFKPNIRVREHKPTPSRDHSVTSSANSVVTESQSSVSAPAPSGPMARSILPIPIRADLTIFIQGLPFDLSESEAKKISNVIIAMATIT